MGIQICDVNTAKLTSSHSNVGSISARRVEPSGCQRQESDRRRVFNKPVQKILYFQQSFFNVDTMREWPLNIWWGQKNQPVQFQPVKTPLRSRVQNPRCHSASYPVLEEAVFTKIFWMIDSATSSRAERRGAKVPRSSIRSSNLLIRIVVCPRIQGTLSTYSAMAGYMKTLATTDLLEATSSSRLSLCSLS